jgi:hypothetical protein
MIVCIPTKGRAETNTYQLFEKAGFTVYHFIEPQEYDEYDVPNKINIKQNDMGISYVRNFMLSWCKQKKLKWSWFCDDDILHFGRFNGKTTKTDANELWEVYEIAKKLPFEMVGIGTRAFSWTAKKNISINSNFVEGCVMLHVEKINWKYRDNTKEDRDFCLQCIAKGHGIIRFNKIFYDTPVVGSNKGGLNEWYNSKLDYEASKKLVLTWSPWIKLKQKKTRLDIKADLSGFAKSCMRKVI